MARNALKWGTGGLNIDGTRIRSVDEVRTNSRGDSGLTGVRSTYSGGDFKPLPSYQTEGQKLGRWPANLILQHRADCQWQGTKEAPSPHDYGFEAPVAMEVDDWLCVPGCPVADLDEQSGFLQSGTGAVKRQSSSSQSGNTSYAYGAESRPEGTIIPTYGDEGGASRFFKQVQSAIEDFPFELSTYLMKMISPPDEMQDKAVVHIVDLDKVDWPTWKDESVSGLLVQGTPTDEQAAELMRVLMPGAHLLLVAPDEQPTGHTGACRIEDAGFEIRDAILLAEEAGGLHYVPKASRSEREAGCQGLAGKAGHEAVERKEGTAGLNNPRAGAGRTASHVKNFHPTVKAIGIMARLLQDIPDDAVVCDPFMGSGTTGIACAKTGHDFIGIEMGEEYIEIADARIRHWRSVFAGHRPRATVISDVDGSDEIVIDTKPEGGIFDLFWDDSGTAE